MVTLNVPDYGLMLGVPARLRGWACRCGMTLKQAAPDRYVCETCGNEYELRDEKLSPLNEVQNQ